MSGTIFVGTAQVELQGSSALQFIKVDQTGAEYRIIGFEEPIVLVDRRVEGLNAISHVLRTGEVGNFALQFNAPAQVCIQSSDSNGIRINLDDTDDLSPRHMLWIAVGIQESVPVYDYLFDRLEPLDGERFAFLALFRRSPDLAPTDSISMELAI